MNRRKFIKSGAIWVPAIVGLQSKAQVLTLADPARVLSSPSASNDVPAGTLINEDFEGAGTPSGWTGSGPVDFDESVIVLQGLQSLELDASSGSPTAYKSYTAQSSAQYFFDFQLASTPADFYNFAYFMTSAFSTLGAMSIGWNRKVRITPSGGTATTGTYVLSTGVHYRAWVTYAKGTGANAAMTVVISTTDSKSDQVESLSISDGTATNNAEILYLSPLSGFGILYIDRVRVDPA